MKCDCPDVHTLALDGIREVVAVAVRSETVLAVAAAVSLLAQGMAVLEVVLSLPKGGAAVGMAQAMVVNAGAGHGSHPSNRMQPRFYITIAYGEYIALGHLQDDCKVLPKLLMVSLSNHVRLEPASFDKLRMRWR